MVKTLIRHANDADLPILLEIDRASFPDGVAYDSEELSYFMSLQGAETIILEHEGKIAAFLIMEVDRRAKTSTIVTLDVCEDSRRMGFGSRLMQKSEEILGGYAIETYTLQVDVENKGAIEFYERHGFKSARRIRNYYPNGNDAWLMVKKLPGRDAR